MSQNEDIRMLEYELLYLVRDSVVTYDELLKDRGLESVPLGRIRGYLEREMEDRYGSLTLELVE